MTNNAGKTLQKPSQTNLLVLRKTKSAGTPLKPSSMQAIRMPVKTVVTLVQKVVKVLVTLVQKVKIL
jgi:hypothetical protein